MLEFIYFNYFYNCCFWKFEPLKTHQIQLFYKFTNYRNDIRSHFPEANNSHGKKNLLGILFFLCLMNKSVISLSINQEMKSSYNHPSMSINHIWPTAWTLSKPNKFLLMKHAGYKSSWTTIRLFSWVSRGSLSYWAQSWNSEPTTIRFSSLLPLEAVCGCSLFIYLLQNLDYMFQYVEHRLYYVKHTIVLV